MIFNDADVSITAKFSRQRAAVAETAADRHTRLAAESKAKKAARQTGPVVPLHTKTADEQTINEAGGIRDAQVVDPNKLPNANQANGGVSRQAADFISTVARLFNKRVVFFTSAALKADGLWTLGDTLFINAHSQTAPLRVLGHELTHAMERESPKAYAQMMQSVQHLLTDEQLMDQHSDYFGESLADAQALDAPYQGTTMREFLAKEWLADLSGNRFSETSFWNDLFTGIEAQQGSATAKSIVTRLRMAFLNVLAKLKSFVQGQAYGVDARLADHLEAIRLAVKDGFIAYEQAAKQGALVAGKEGTVSFSTPREAAQHADVEAKYRGTPQWLKAPNGQPTKLNERQWVQVRTPAFKAWFGNWQYDSEMPVNITKISGKEIGEGPLSARRIKEWILREQQWQDSPVINADTGNTIGFTVQGIKDSLKRKSDEQRKAYAGLRGLLENAVFVDFEPVREGKANEAHLQGYEVYYGGLDIDGERFGVRLKVELPKTETAHDRAYKDHKIIDVELHSPAASLGSNASASGVGDPVSGPTQAGGSTISLGQLVGKNKPEASKVVDDNGEPLVVYHGGGDFTENKKNSRFGGIFVLPYPSNYGKSTSSFFLKGRVMSLSDIKTSVLEENDGGSTVLSSVLKKEIESDFSEDIIQSLTDNSAYPDEEMWKFIGAIDEADAQLETQKVLGRLAEHYGASGVTIFDEFDGDTIFVPGGNANLKSAIGNNGDFSPGNPDIRFSRQRTALGPLTPEQTAAAQHVLGTPKTLLQRLQDFKKDWAMNLKQGIFDQFAPIMALNPQAYWLARLSKGGDSTLEALMMYGKLSLGADGSTQAQYTKAGGLQGFAPQMAKLKGEHDRFFLWVAALRADRLKGIGLENLWSADDITHLKTLNAGAMLDGTMRPPLYAAALQQLNDFNDNILEIAEKSGLIDADTRQLYKDQPYIPFYRLNEDDQVNGFNIKPGLVNQTAWKKLKGGTDKLNEDLMANLLQNWSHLITASAKNRAAKATLEAAVAIGVAESIPSGAPGKGHVSYREGGKEKAFILSDPHLMDAVAALHYAGLGDLAKPFTLAKYFLTIGVTANPAFKIRNLIRDTLASIGTSSLSANPARNLKQGWTATAKESETRAQMMAGGGMIRFGSMLDGKNSQRAKDLIHEGVLPEHILDSPSKIAQFWKKTGRPALNAYNELGDRLEQVNRAALYEQLLAKGISPTEAAFQARDLMDFQMGGQWAAVRLLTQTVPFMNARLQGLYKLGRATKEDYKRVGTVVGAVALASLALLLAYQDDEDWKARSEADRNNYWWFKVDGKAYRVPKPFEIGAIGTLAERGYEKMFDPEMTNKRFGGVMRDLVMSQLSMNPVPQLVKPLADIYANKDNFSGAPIEGLGMEKLKKADRLTSKTSEVARFLGGLGLPNPAQLAMGRWESLSPVQIDYLAKAYFSWLGTMTTTVLDYGIRPMMNRGERPEMKLKDVFLVGNFVESLPASGSRYVTQMYDQAKEIEQAYSSYKHLLKLGDLAGAKEALAEDHDLIVRYPATEALKGLESKISAQMRRVEASTTMSPAQKRIQLDTLTIKRNQVALNFKAR